MYRLQQTDDGWQVLDGDAVLSTHPDHESAFAALNARIEKMLADIPLEPGVPMDDLPATLSERWYGPLALSEMTDDGRDFTECQWTWRDPAVVPLALMLQTKTEMGHYGAEWAGFMDTLSLNGGIVYGGGGFLDTEEGRKARDMLAGVGRMGVSVDPAAVEWEDICTEMSPDGYCTDGYTKFLAYQVFGVTITPFPAFDATYIELEGAQAEPAAEPATEEAVVAASAPVKPPKAWFDDPQLTERTPLTILDDGRLFGLVADFATCHVGYKGVCVTAPDRIALDLIHTGLVRTKEGVDVATAPLVFHADHAPQDLATTATRARDHYSHTGLAWADYRVGVTPGLGVWIAGAVRPEFMTDAHLRVLRASALSGDWRDLGDGKLSLCAVLTVNSPGFPIPRALAASGAPYPHAASTRFRVKDGVVVSAQGLGMVAQKCASCEESRLAELARSSRLAGGVDPAVMRVLTAMVKVVEQVDARLAVLDRRTKPLAAQAAAAQRERLARIVPVKSVTVDGEHQDGVTALSVTALNALRR